MSRPINELIEDEIANCNLSIFIDDSKDNMYTWVAKVIRDLSISIAMRISGDKCMIIIKPIIKIDGSLMKGASRVYNKTVDGAVGWFKLNLPAYISVLNCYERLISNMETELNNNYFGYVASNSSISSKDASNNEYIKTEWNVYSKIAFDTLNVRMSIILLKNNIICRRKIGDNSDWKVFSKGIVYNDIMKKLSNEIDSIRGQLFPDPFVYDLLAYDNSHFGENIVLFPIKRTNFEEGDK